MRSCEHNVAISHFSVHHCRTTISAINMKILCIARQRLHPVTLKLLRIDKHTTTIVIALELLLHILFHPLPQLRLNLQPCRSRPSLRVIHKPLKSQSPADPGIKLQLTVPDNTHLGIMGFKLAPRAAIVPPSAKPKVASATIDIGSDAAITRTIEGFAVAQVSAAGEDEQSTGRIPGFFDDDLAGNWDYSVGGGQEPPEGVETVAD